MNDLLMDFVSTRKYSSHIRPMYTLDEKYRIKTSCTQVTQIKSLHKQINKN